MTGAALVPIPSIPAAPSLAQVREFVRASKAENKGANPRFVVTSLSSEQMAAQELYEKGYCTRGDCPENRIKEQQLDLFADRTFTGKMWSNQLRKDSLPTLVVRGLPRSPASKE